MELVPSVSWQTRSLPDLERLLDTGIHKGLSGAEAQKRLVAYGKNELPSGKEDSIFLIFLRQFQSPLIYLLLSAGLVVFLLGELGDAFIILFVTILNAIIGTFQEGKAQNALAALRKFTEGSATVLRGGEELIIPDKNLVPGDVIVIREGEKIPADARIIESYNLRINESALTGESVPVHKIDRPLIKQVTAPADAVNMAFKGTYAVGGRAKAIVVATGLETAIGKVSATIAEIDTEIPLRANIRYLSRAIVVAVFMLIGVIFILGVAKGQPLLEMFRTVVALAVSLIPEGLPVVITVVLATGVWRMAKRNALVKRLQAVEALGQARVIAVDKTGTITKNELVVRKAFVGGKLYEISGYGYEPKGDVLLAGNIIDPLNHAELVLAGKVAALSGNAEVARLEGGQWRVAGDPTEAALLVFSEKIGFRKSELEKDAPEIFDRPFDYRTKYHLTSHRTTRDAETQFLCITGAPEAVLAASKLTDKEREEFEDVMAKMTREGLRVVAYAHREAPLLDGESANVSRLVFGGFFGIEDSLRPEVHDALARAREAGVRVVMITGDHRNTAVEIARQAGIYVAGDSVITGDELGRMSEEELAERLGSTTVFARIQPEDKMKIVNGYRRRGEIVAMTGDGVNDAPSLVAADLGVAMGMIGTEVTKEASDIVLLDDNFGSIVSAIEEGRNIYKTIKKVILYLFSTSFGEAFTIMGALFLGWPLPILPAQIVWLNLVTDGFLNVGLAMEPKEKGLLSGTFERPKKYLVDRLMVARIPGMAFTMMAGSLAIFGAYLTYDLPKALTMSLTTLAIFQWFNAWNCRSERQSIFGRGMFANKYLIGATAIVVGLQIAAVYTPFLNLVLHTVPLTFAEWGIAALVSVSIIVVEELRKLLYRTLLGRR